MMISKYKIRIFFISAITLFLFSNVHAEEFEATLNWSKRVELSTPVNGVVSKVFSQVGTVVAKGEVLVQLDPRGFKADVIYAKAQLKHSDDARQEARRELERQEDMYDRAMLSDHDLQIAKNNYSAAQSQFKQANSSLIKAKLNLEYSSVRAPFNAIVVKTNAVKGQVVATNMAPPVLVVVAEANRMLARFFVADSKLASLSLNQMVGISVAGKAYKGKIHRIGLEQEKSNNYAVDIIFDSKDSLLRAGQKAKVNL